MVKSAACILEPTVAVKQRVRVGIGSQGSVQRIKHQPVVVTIAYGISDNTSVVKVQNSAQINLAYLRSKILFEFRHVCQPFPVRRVGVKVAIQIIFGYVLR